MRPKMFLTVKKGGVCDNTLAMVDMSVEFAGVLNSGC
jgi:hypothetical protein